MPLVPAKCVNCGAALEVDPSLVKAVCPHCHTTYLVQDAINHFVSNQYTKIEHVHADVIQMVDENSAENKARSGDAFLRMGDYRSARNMYEQITRQAPYDARGWWGLVRVDSKEFQDLTVSEQALAQMRASYDKARMFSHEPELIGRTWDAYEASVRAKLAAAEEERQRQLREAKRAEEERRENERRQKVYDEAAGKAQDKDARVCENAAELFESIAGFRDAREQAAACRERAAKLRASKRAKTIAGLCVLAVALAFGAFVMIAGKAARSKAGENVKWAVKGDTLTFTGEGMMYDYSGSYDCPWDEINKKTIHKVEIGEGITYLGSYFYRGFPEDCEVSLPSTLEAVGEYAFDSTLTKIELPEGIRCIRSLAFAGTHLSEVEIPAPAEHVDPAAFAYCPDLAEIRVAAGNKYYSAADGVLFNKDGSALLAYPRGRGAESYAVPDEVVCIAYNAFLDSSVSLQDLTLGAGTDLSKAWKDAHADLARKYVSHLYVKQNVFKEIFSGQPKKEAGAAEAWEEAEGQRSILEGERPTVDHIYVAEGSPLYSSSDGVLFNADGTELVWYPIHYQESTSYAVPKGVVRIAPYAFSSFNNTTIEAVTLPDSLEEIGESAFAYCTHLTEVTIPDGVTSLGDQFNNCSRLERVYLPAGLAEISVYAFAGDEAIQEMVYPGKISDWEANVTVYAGPGKEAEQQALHWVDVTCSDGVIEKTR